jgi:hypothetical protein
MEKIAREYGEKKRENPLPGVEPRRLAAPAFYSLPAAN